MLYGQRRSHGDKRETSQHSSQKKEQQKNIKTTSLILLREIISAYFAQDMQFNQLIANSSCYWLTHFFFFTIVIYIFSWFWPIFDAFWTQCRRSCTMYTHYNFNGNRLTTTNNVLILHFKCSYSQHCHFSYTQFMCVILMLVLMSTA